jgi:hypothetical protein
MPTKKHIKTPMLHHAGEENIEPRIQANLLPHSALHPIANDTLYIFARFETIDSNTLSDRPRIIQQ